MLAEANFLVWRGLSNCLECAKETETEEKSEKEKSPILFGSIRIKLQASQDVTTTTQWVEDWLLHLDPKNGQDNQGYH